MEPIARAHGRVGKRPCRPDGMLNVLPMPGADRYIASYIVWALASQPAAGRRETCELVGHHSRVTPSFS